MKAETTTATGDQQSVPAAPCVQLLCPACNEASATFSLNLGDGAMECLECNEAFEWADIVERVAELERHAARWRRVLAWASSAPAE